MALLALAPLIANAGDNAASVAEYQIKAAYLYKFPAYVDWPAAAFTGPGASFTVGVVGADDLATELEKLASSHSIGHRPTVVKRINAGDSLEDIQMLFIASAGADRLTTLLAATQNLPVLIVTESDGALSTGSMINFVWSQNHVRFEIALGTAQKHGLRISAMLLSVAQRVTTTTP